MLKIEKYQLLALSDFNPQYIHQLDLPRKGLSYPQSSKLLHVCKGEIVEILDKKADWWIKARKMSQESKNAIIGMVPSSLFVPIKLGCSVLPENLDESDKIRLLPDLKFQDMKYFPLLSTFYGTRLKMHENPIPKSSFLSRLFYSWISSYINLGFKRYLVEGDMWVPIASKRIHHLKDQLLGSKKDRAGHTTLVPRFLSQNKLKVFLAITCKFLQDIIKFSTPQFIKMFIKYSANSDRTIWKGIVLCLVLFFIRICDSMLLTKYYEYVTLVAVDFRSLLSSLVYQKLFTARSDCIAKYPLSLQTNLVSVDSYRVADAITGSLGIESSLLQILLCLAYLYMVMGLAFLPGVGIVLTAILINILITNISKSIEAKQMKLKDQRMKLITAFLNGIRLIKLNYWESQFSDQVSEIRKRELKQILKVRVLNSIIYAYMMVTPIFITLATFFTYIQINEFINATVAYESIAIFGILRIVASDLPEYIQGFITGRISYIRICDFLSYPDHHSQQKHQSNEISDKNVYLTLKDASFTFFGRSEPFLKHLNLSAKSGSLNLIVGETSAGKTQLLQSMLGQSILVDGHMEICGEIYFLPQNPWIRNASFRENIINGKPYIPSQYQHVTDVCELRQDILQLQNGDETELGEKGSNLSDGQKRRVALARAIYARSDIYLFDDLFSHFDYHMGVKLFKNIFSRSGYLSDKLVILVADDFRFLEQADCIYLMKNGEIVKSGKPTEICNDPYLQEIFLGANLPFKSTCAGSISRVEGGEPSTDDFEQCKNTANSKPLVEADVVMKGRVKGQIYLQYMKSQSLKVFLVFLFGIPIYYGFDIFGNISVATYTSGNIYKHNSTNFFLLYGMTIGGQCVLILIISCFQMYGTYLASKNIHHKLLTYLSKASISFYESTAAGRILNGFAREMSIIDVNLPQAIKILSFLVFSLLFSLFGISYFMPYLLIGIIILVVIYLLIQIYYIKSSRQIQRLESLTRAPILSLLMDTINGLSVINSNKAMDKYVERFDELIDFNNVPFKMNMYSRRWLSVRLEIIGNVLVFLSAISVVVKSYSNNILKGVVGYILFTSTSVTQTLSLVVRFICEVENSVVSVERVSAFYDAKPEPEKVVPVLPPPTWPENGQITFKNYSCRYRSHLPNVLHSINITIKENERIGITGRTGSGKSSLVLSLFRMIDEFEGEITIDGVNIADISLEKLRTSLTIIPQDPFLFHDTIRNNLDPMNQYTDAEIWKAIESSQLSSFVNNLPGGLDYMIDDFQSNISSGEKQLICLARSLLKRSKILVLDEATSNIDLKTDSIIQEIISREFRNCTIITVAHRIETIIKYDRILVLENGTVAECDSPQNLLSKEDSLFRSLALYSLSEATQSVPK